MKLVAVVAVTILLLLFEARASTSPTSSSSTQLIGHNAIQIFAHRGAPEFLPEHTLPSYELAIRQLVDFVELDLCLTADAKLICLHDIELSGTTNVADMPEFANRRKTITLPDGSQATGWFTNDFNLTDIKKLRTKQRLPIRDQSFNGFFSIPTLTEAIQHVKKVNGQLGTTTGLYIELKQPTYFRRMGLEYDTVFLKELKQNGMVVKGSPDKLSKVIIECFESTQLEKLRPKMDFHFIQLIAEPWVIQADTQYTYVNMMDKEGMSEIAKYADGIGPIKSYFEPQNVSFIARTNPDTLIGQEAVDYAHSLDLLVHVWTLRNEWEDPYIPVYFNNSERLQLKYLFELGIDGIFSESADTAFWTRKEYEQSFYSTPITPIAPDQFKEAIPLMVMVPVLIATMAVLVGIAIGRYALPLIPMAKDDDSFSLLANPVQ